jgi:membrane protease YdiL (CAAX protease family)
MAKADGGGTAPKYWGYLATIAWAVAAFLFGQIAALGVVVAWKHGNIRAVSEAPFDGANVALSVLVLNPAATAIILFAIWLVRAPIAEYLALKWPRTQYVTIGIIGIAILIAVTDGLLFATGRAIVSPFQTLSYESAAVEGWLPLLWIATVLFAPAGEEIMFRGFLFRGFISSDKTIWSMINLRSIAIALALSVLVVLVRRSFDPAAIVKLYLVGLLGIVVVIACDYGLLRGFELLGLGRQDFSGWRAILAVSLLWALPHKYQYDWAGVAEIFVAGLLLGWVRWRSGSTLLTFLLHGLFNLEGMLETALQAGPLHHYA